VFLFHFEFIFPARAISDSKIDVGEATYGWPIGDTGEPVAMS